MKEIKSKTHEKVFCSICGKYIKPKGTWIFGNNAEPINNGRCCDKCNYEIVIPERIKRFEENK
jgi:hypothetical protein